jgi:hypothetical protein
LRQKSLPGPLVPLPAGPAEVILRANPWLGSDLPFQYRPNPEPRARVAEASGLLQTTKQLKEWEAVLERARLLHEDTLCHDSLTEAERTWLRLNRSKEAEYWDLLTDLSPEHLRDINLNPEPETMVPDVPSRTGDET